MHLIGQEIALVHIKATVEGGHKLFPRETLPACIMCRRVREGERGGRKKKTWDAAVAFECVPERSLLCVLHCLISLCAKQHHTLYSSAPFSLPAV